MSIASVVSLAARKIGELLIEEAKLLYGVEDRVKSLQDELMMMQSFLVDMEAIDEERGDERSRTTIKQIRKIAYDAEDLIESYILENSYSTNKMEDFLKRYVCFCSSIVHTHQFGSEIEAIVARIVNTIDRCKRYMFEHGIIRSDARQGLNKRNRLGVWPISYPHTPEDHVVGLEEDINKLIKVLISDDENIEVVLFVGMGGSGKTTLARKLYNHEAIVKHFDYVAWVSISRKRVVKQILLDLLKKVGGESMRTDGLSSSGLVENLHQCLQSKRFLIVLDDVWEKEALEQILPAFPLKSNGRKVIVTTRNQDVVDFPDVNSFIHEPRRLTEEESWELFRKIALIHKGSILTVKPELETLGKDMLKKCKGLPLAVIALAGILGKKETVEEWEKMKKAVTSRIMEDGCGTHLYGSVNEMLMLSHYDLPPQLKPCFLYLAMFPEGYEIPIGQLIRMWIAEGFIKPREGHTLEDVARRYLDELIHRCMVQIAKKIYQGMVSRIRIHDLVRDVCVKKANEEDFLDIFSSKSRNSDILVTESRRVAIYSSNRIYSTTKSQHLRSVIYDGLPEIQPSLSLLLHEELRLLRVLILQRVTISDGTLPAGIGNLIHLRYLRLFDTNITKLSSSIGNLRKLITLDYRQLQAPSDLSTNSDLRIPDVIWKIEGLRHLYLPMSGAMKQPLKFHTLKHLHTLFGMQGGDWMLKQLPLLSQSVRKLNIRDMKSVKHLEAVFECPSIRLDLLHSLELSWASMHHSLTVKQEILEPIIQSQHLSKLKLFGRMRDGLQGGSWPTSISTLWLIESGFEAEATVVAIANLPRLSYLLLSVNSYMGIRWTCSAGQFPWLIQLNIVGLPNLEEWRIERGAMPQLLKLGLVDCMKLSRVPDGLKFITTLQELRLARMSDEFNKRVKGEDAHIIQNVSLVRFNYNPNWVGLKAHCEPGPSKPKTGRKRGI